MGLWSSLKRLFGFGDDDEAAAPAPRTTTYARETGLVEITAPAPPSRSPTAQEQAHHQFITSNWPKLAAAAYAGFRRHGIGVVVVEKRESETAAALSGAFETHDLAYATGMGNGAPSSPHHGNSVWTQSPPHSAAPDWLDEQFQNYEPLEAGLFLFRIAAGEANDTGASTPPRPYHAAGTPAPPEALKQARAPFN